MSKERIILEEFVQNALYRIDESTRMIRKSFEQLSEDDIWQRPNDSSNSVGNLILHLCGNITQYVISSLGENKDDRERDLEFSTTAGYNKDELLNKLVDTVDIAKRCLGRSAKQKTRGTRLLFFRYWCCVTCGRALFVPYRTNCFLDQTIEK